MNSARKLIVGFVWIALICWGCSPTPESGNLPENTPTDESFKQVEQPTSSSEDVPVDKCGDGVCDAQESQSGCCPEDCPESLQVESEKISEFEYYVTNPTSGSKLYVRIFPSHLSLAEIPTLILIPGGTGDSAMFTDEILGGPAVEQLGIEGFNIVVFDPEGRGRSEGTEDYNGHIGQGGLYAVTEFINAFPHVGTIGYFSQSYGVSLAAGVLARYSKAPVDFLIDWEGPANRNDITMGCRSTNTDPDQQTAPQEWSCADDLYWAEREAEVFASQIRVPYHRVQSLVDHAQPDVSHAEDMIRASTSQDYGGNGISPWTKLNDLTPNTIYSPLDESLLEEIDRDKYILVRGYARTLFNMAEETAAEPIAQQGVKLYLGLMVHLEGWFDEVDDRIKFEKHMSEALELAEIFEEHGAKITFEASPETIAANEKWDNVLLDLQNRGHGIGVHADKGYSSNPNYNQARFTVEIQEMKEGAENLGLTIEHVSGICSHLDWAKAAINAGYLFTTGGVGYCAMSMPEELRPEPYKNCPSPAECHGNLPLEMSERIHPWRVDSARGDWTVHDPEGRLVILSSDSGIKNLFEETQDSSLTHGDMEYSEEDISVLVRKVEEALAVADPDQVNQIYFSLSIGAADIDRAFYESMFQSLAPFVEAGQLEYKSMNEVYHIYQQGQ